MIDFQAGEPQFVDHLAPIYLALPERKRGAFATPSSLRGRLASWGIAPGEAMDTARPVVVASYGDQKKVRRQGRRRIVRVEHGAGQSYGGDNRFGTSGSYAGGRDNHDAGLILCPNEHSAGRWAAAYPGARVEIVGCAKLDHLPGRQPGPVTIAISFHFNIPLIPETLWAWPAYRPVLPELAGRFNVIAHGHPKGIDFLHRHYLRMGIPVVPDFADVCRRADVYVCDNSSTLFEFASTGRPVVVLNIPEYRRDVHHGLRFWDAADVGLQCDRPEDLGAIVAEALEDGHQGQREAALDIVYAHRSGAARRAADAILDWAAPMARVA